MHGNVDKNCSGKERADGAPKDECAIVSLPSDFSGSGILEEDAVPCNKLNDSASMVKEDNAVVVL